ncbi:MAG TPA: NB-ARC domain-containing protein [Ktedonobacteraceae bacterium]|nr:NB-ARC domain-containing protein [Ktedonobacteraceae bacterium]
MGERLTDFVIITALQEELQALLDKLPSPQRLPPTDEDVRVYYQADLPITFSNGATGAYRLVLMSLLGMGRVQAANATNDAIRRWHPRFVLLVGIAGGIAAAQVKRGDVLIPDQIADYEHQKITNDGAQIRWEVHRADPRLLEAARHQRENWLDLIKKRRPQRGKSQYRIGPMATGDKVVATKDVLERLRSDWPKLIGIEMEAGGLASAAFQSARQPGFLMIRGVSDLADENKDDTWRKYACHAAAAYAIALLQSGPAPLSKQEEGSSQNKEHLGRITTQEISQTNVAINFVPARPVRRHDNYWRTSLSPHYIERPQVLAEVRKTLLNGVHSVALTSAVMTTPAVLHGMGGIGKTAIARALCDDPTIQQAFPDGILWATLGQTPDLVGELRLWIQALGGTVTESAPTIDSLRLILAQLLEDRTCLLILDDVWQYKHAEVFQLGRPRCRLLLTTRQAEIATKLGAHTQPIPLMTPDDAITLLDAWASEHLANVDRAVKEQIVKRLGYLPLAIRLAGPQLVHRSPQEWLHDFDIRKLRFHQIETAHDSLEVTFDLSLEMLNAKVRRLYLNLAIFKEDETIPQVGIEHLWQELSGLSAEKATDVLIDLAEQALLELPSDGTTQWVQLHDLLRDLIRIRLGDGGIIEAHGALLKAYRGACKGSGWHTAEDDGYLYNHLAYHLRAASEVQELKGLFADQHWLQARVPQRAYTYDGYLADLSLAMEYASSETKGQIEADQEPESFANCIRYTLIHTSINSIAGNHVPELIARAVQVGVWTPDQAMSIARNIPQAEQQTNAYLLLLETEKLSKKHQEKAQQAVLEYARTMREEDAKARMLARLAPLLTEELFEQAVAVAETMADRLAYANLSMALLPQLIGEKRTKTLRSVLDAILPLNNDISRRDLFKTLVPQLTDDLLASALNAALEGTNGLDRVDMLFALAPRLTGNLLEQALEATLAIPGPYERGWCLIALAPQLTETMLNRAIRVTFASTNEWVRARMIAALSPRLEGVFLQQALDNALAISDDRARDWALAALARWCQFKGEPLEQVRKAALSLLKKGLVWPAVHMVRQLDDKNRDQMLQEILEAIPSVEYTWEKPEVLKAVAALLTDELLKQALAATLNEADDEVRPYMLGALAPQLRNGLLQKALEAALQEKDEKIHPYMLEVLAPQLTEVQLDQALQAILKIQDKGTRLRALEKLAPRLRDEQYNQALTHALELILTAETEDERMRVEAFVTLAPQLRGEPLKRALAATENIKDVWVRMRMFAALVPQMSGELLEQALQTALDMRGEGAYRRALITMAPRLGDEQRSQTLTHALEVSLAMTDVKERAQLLAKLVPHLEGEQRNRALINAFETAMTLPRQWPTAQLLATLVPYLSGERRNEAIVNSWEIAQELVNENLLAQVLEALVLYLNDKYLGQAHQVASDMKDKRARTQLLFALAPTLSDEQRDQTLTGAFEDILAEANEQIRIRLLAKLAPQLSGEQRVQALTHILELARLITDEQLLADALVPVIPLLTGEQQQWALQTVLTTSNQWVLAAALIKVKTQLNGTAQEQAIQAALKIGDEWLRAQILAAFLPALSDQRILLKLIRQAMVNVLSFLQNQPLQNVLLYYLSNDVFMTPILSPKILGAITSHIIEICQEWSWQ